MAGTTRLPERRRRTLIDLPEEILSEILLLLPPKSILRCRAVCKALLRVASDRNFLLAHHRRQPPRRLLSFIRDVGVYPENLGVFDYCVEALDLRTHEFRSVVRFIADDYGCSVDENPLAVHATCDGLLLISFHNLLYVCNPATRQWISILSPALQHDTVMGLYAHGPSSEYRVLYCRHIDRKPQFFISTVGSEKEMCIRPCLSPASVKKWWGKSEDAQLNEPFLFNGNLHWLPFRGQLDKILVFDTMDEVFWWLHVPFEICLVASLLEIEGTVAMSNSHIGSSEVDLWLLQDYKRGIWVHKYHVELPVMDISHFEKDGEWCSNVVSQERDVLVDGLDWQLHYDVKGNFLKKFQCNGRMLNCTTHILRESLVRHAFFQMQKNGGTHEPPFFQGL